MTTRAQRRAKSPKIEALIGQDRELLKELVKESVQEVLEAEMTEALGARAGERTAERTARSGYYSRGLVTRIGKLELRVPRDREGRFSTELFERYQRAEKALVSALAEMYVQGVSTRKVKAITEELCGHTFSASTISRINKSLDGLLQRFAQRRLDEAYPYLTLDARYEKVRLDGVIQSQAVFVAIGINTDGTPDPGRGALEPGVPLELDGVPHRPQGAGVARGGVCRVRRPCGAQTRGPGTAARGGVAALLRAFLAQCPGLPAPQGRRRLSPGAALALRPAQSQRSPAGPAGLAHALGARYPKLTDWVEQHIGETLNFYRLPRQHHKHLKSTNMLERLNEEIKRRTRVVRIFPNPASCLRLVRALCAEIHEAWLEDHRYLNMDYWKEQKKDFIRTAA